MAQFGKRSVRKNSQNSKFVFTQPEITDSQKNQALGMILIFLSLSEIRLKAP